MIEPTEAEARLPDFLIIGAMKSATTTLHAQLAAQPAIFMSEPKEPNFFSDEANWRKGMDWYRGLFAGAGAGAAMLAGESSTHYTKLPDHPEALPRIREWLPQAKLIYVMRHPVQRLLSHYSHGWLERSIDGPVDEAVHRYPELIDYGRYAMQIGPYLETFGRENVLPVFFERLVSSPQTELERVCAFLGYEGNPVWAPNLERQNVSQVRIRKSALHDLLVWNPVATYFRHRLVPQSVRDRVKSVWQLKRKPQLSHGTEIFAVERFDADLAQLGEWLDVRLDCGNFAAEARSRQLDWCEARRDRKTHQ